MDDDANSTPVKSNSNNSSGFISGSLSDQLSPVAASTPCDSCASHVSQLLNAQQKIHDLEKHIVSLERYKQELSKETAFRKEMEVKWNEKKEEYKEQVIICIVSERNRRIRVFNECLFAGIDVTTENAESGGNVARFTVGFHEYLRRYDGSSQTAANGPGK